MASPFYHTDRIPLRDLVRCDGKGLLIGVAAVLLLSAIIAAFWGSPKGAHKAQLLDIVVLGNTAVEIYGSPKDEDVYLKRGIVFRTLLDRGFLALSPQSYTGGVAGIPAAQTYKCVVNPAKKQRVVIYAECGQEGNPQAYRRFDSEDPEEAARWIERYARRVANPA